MPHVPSEQQELMDAVVEAQLQANGTPYNIAEIIEGTLWEIRSRLEYELLMMQEGKMEQVIETYESFARSGTQQVAKKSAHALNQRLSIACWEMRSRIHQLEQLASYLHERLSDQSGEDF